MPRTPTATYRIQFSSAFGFRDAIELVPYLEQLGISHVYASPLLKPAPGSTHGYDVVDPTRLNPELGEESDFQELLDTLARHNMGLILDIVPNHMAVNSQNAWWQDVLEHGQRSRFARYFDIDWDQGDGKIVLPTLGDHFGEILERGELRLGIDELGLAVNYYENRFPVDPASYQLVLAEVRQSFQQASGRSGYATDNELDAIIDLSQELAVLAGHPDEIKHAATGLGRRTWNLYREGEDIRAAFQTVFDKFNGVEGDPETFDDLQRLLDAQHYRLTFWRRASEKINYRRFFDIGDLISLRIEDPEVFDAVHALVLEYAGSDGIDGFRADHVDGLLDPQGYAKRLNARLAEASDGDADHVLLFEKILTGDEQLPPDWPISGTTGYEFAHRVNALMVEPEGFARIEAHYATLTGLDGGFQEIVHTNKAKVLDDLFSGQFEMLVDGLYDLALAHRQSRDLSQRQLASALRRIMIELPVYRTYVGANGTDQRDRQILQETLDIAREASDGIEDAVWDFLADVFTAEEAAHEISGRISWIQRWQQFTGPLMAKGLEDTALYVYTPLTSLNEVGGDPESLTPQEFHAHNQHIAEHWPASMLTTSTHDTKRSEDVRARIAVLSELADEWLEHLDAWRAANAPLRETVGGIPVPDPNEEQLIYQTLLGAWPLDRSQFAPFRERIKEYLIKAMRETKVHTNWIAVDEEHEQAVLRFVDRIFDSDPGGRFFRDFIAFQTRISSYGAWNSLSQLVLKLTSPGIPDIYQGNELWDFSLADPDNRRPVDYQLRSSQIEHLGPQSEPPVPELVHQWRDGRIKMLVTARVLSNRRADPEPFATGDYLPLSFDGERASNAIAFARRVGNAWSMSVVPLHTTRLAPADEAPVGEAVWGDTCLLLPDDAPSTWVDVITGATISASPNRTIRVADILTIAPVSVLRSQK